MDFESRRDWTRLIKSTKLKDVVEYYEISKYKLETYVYLRFKKPILNEDHLTFKFAKANNRTKYKFRIYSNIHIYTKDSFELLFNDFFNGDYKLNRLFLLAMKTYNSEKSRYSNIEVHVEDGGIRYTTKITKEHLIFV